MSAQLANPLEEEFWRGVKAMIYIFNSWAQVYAFPLQTPLSVRDKTYAPRQLGRRKINLYSINGEFTSREDTPCTVTPVRVQQGLELLMEKLVAHFGSSNASEIGRYMGEAFPVFEEILPQTE